ncbi:HMA2 domain-containing protein [Campylobacter suis]|uniref:Heavy-metal-associated domain-containing protein n=1 Tax=Campylobacter suis TaxID=2790657 RepID=A0ABN7K2S3_9BACT|nr:hypothetical protein [Campylobacter suis]CAD7286752.1 hypothetical protein LMG8286_00519 [Campylobacter suis]
MEISPKLLVKIASYFTPVSHTPGRIRVRVSSEIKEFASSENLGSLDEIIQKIDGIKDVKLNKIIGSLTIHYDPKIFAKELWDELLEGKNLAHISEKINSIAKKIA